MSKTQKPDFLDNMVQRTDNGYNGVEDESLIGQDLPDDPEELAEEEDRYGKDELAPERSKAPQGERSRDPKSL